MGHLPSEFRTSAINFFGNLFFDVGSREAPFTTLTIASELSVLYAMSQRDITLSQCQRDDENFFQGIPPVVYPQRNISLSRWQRDDENFFLMVYPQ